MIEEILKQIAETNNQMLAEMRKFNSAISNVLAADQPKPAQVSQAAQVNHQAAQTATAHIAAQQVAAAQTAGFVAAAAPITAQVAAQIAAPPTREQVGVALVGLATDKGRDIAMAVLAKFNATKLADIKAEYYANLAAAIKQASEL